MEDKAQDIDLATAAEQSSEEDEAQEGMPLAEQEHSAEAAESAAVHIVDDEAVNLEDTLEAVEGSPDAEADAVVEDALDIDSAAEADASVAATSDESDSAAEEDEV